MASQQALFLESKNGSFVVRQREVPTPGKDDVLIKVLAAALNPVDWKIQTDGMLVESYPTIVGMDIAGEIEAVGDSVEGWKKGDKVLCEGWVTQDCGGFQQYALIPADFVAKKPDNITLDQAVTIPLGFMTACMGLFASSPVGIGLNPTFTWEPPCVGQQAVVIGGSTSVGQHAIQMFKFLGFSEIAVYASEKHHEFLRGRGATQFADRASTPMNELPKAFNGGPISTVFDGVGSTESQQAAYNLLAAGGRAITVMPVDDSIMKPGEDKQVSFVFGNVFPPPNQAFGKIAMQNLSKLIEKGIVTPNRLQIVPGGLAGVEAGLQRLKNNQVSGEKLVVHPQE